MTGRNNTIQRSQPSSPGACCAIHQSTRNGIFESDIELDAIRVRYVLIIIVVPQL